MRKSRRFWAVVFACIWARLAAQDPPEKERVLCDPADPKWDCPGADCPCVPDTLEVTFDGQTDSVFEYDAFKEDMQIDVAVVTETFSEKVQGWSYGVAHRENALLLLEVRGGGATE